MFNFLGDDLRKIGNTFNAAFRDFKTFLFSQFFKSNSNSSQPEPDKSSEFIDPFLENDVLSPGSEANKQDLESHIDNINLLDNPDLSSPYRSTITQKLLSIEDLYKMGIKGIESTANPYQRMKYKGKSDQHKFYLDNEGSFQLISDLEKNNALFEALIEGDPTLTAIASEHAIDLDILHQHKKTIRRSSGSIYGLIQDHPDQNAKLLFAIKHNDLELVDIAFKNGASIKVLTENKDIFSFISKSTDLIDYFQNKYLFASVERPDSNLYALKKELSDFWKTQDENGNTLLHLECSQGNEDAIKELLIIDDIDVTSKNNDGKIALELIIDKDLKSSICENILEKERINRYALALTSSPEKHCDHVVKSKITQKLLGIETLLTIKNILRTEDKSIKGVESLINSHPDNLILALESILKFTDIDIKDKINVLSYASSLKNDVVSFIESALESEISKAEKDVLETEKKVLKSKAIIKDNLENRVKEQLTFKEKLENGGLSDKEKLEITQKLVSPFELDEIKLKNKRFSLNLSDDTLRKLESLIQNHPNQNDKLILALKNSDVELARIALDLGADANATIIPKHPEYRPIHYVTNITGNVEMTKLLLEKGADVNALFEGKTSLDGIAKRIKNPQMVLTNTPDKTSLDGIAEKRNQELITLLELYKTKTILELYKPNTTNSQIDSPSQSPSRTSSASDGSSLSL